MADNTSQEMEIQIGNRRLRKIKRPKQQNKPLIVADTQNEFRQQSYALQPDSYNQSQDFQENSDVPSYVEEPSDESLSYQKHNVFYLANMMEKKTVIGIAVACLCFGLLLGKFFFSGAQVVQNGLQGVVINPEVPKGRSRCGVAEKMQGCVLYVMNPQRQELNGRDFYDLASQLTGRQRFVIETGNMRYSNVKIKPGSIAQLNIPPLQ